MLHNMAQPNPRQIPLILRNVIICTCEHATCPLLLTGETDRFLCLATKRWKNTARGCDISTQCRGDLLRTCRVSVTDGIMISNYMRCRF